MTIIEEEEHNKRVVRDLYRALNSKDKDTLHHLLAQDLEWWFHGPPCHHHHLIPSLTSSSSSSNHFHCVPDIIVSFGSLVIAEGYDEANMVWWVHAWTFNADDGVIHQIREYVNTSVIVKRLGMIAPSSQKVGSLEFAGVSKCQSIWKSKLCCDESKPGVILAI